MPKHSTTIRLDPALYKATLKEARKAGLNFSGVVHLLLLAFTKGEVQVGVTQYPKKYLETLEKEAQELRRLYRAGKARSYSSSKEAFDDILDR